MIIDAHAHVFEGINSFTGSGELKALEFGKVKRGTGEIFRLLPPCFLEGRFPPEVLLEYMDWIGVDKAILLQGTLYGFYNEYVANAQSRWPDRFLGCALVDPMIREAPRVLEHAVEELGLRALKFEISEGVGLSGIHPEMQLNSPQWLDIYERAKEYHIPLIFDTGPVDTIGYQVEHLRNLIESYPELSIVITHLGLPSFENENNPEIHNRWLECISLGKYKNVWIDLASLPALFDKEEYPYPTAQKYVKVASEIVGSDRLIWGTDIPGILTKVTYKQSLDLFKNHCDFLSTEQKKHLLGDNAAGLFKLSE